MPEAVEYRGFWWSPDNADEQMPGQLSINSSNDAILELQVNLSKHKVRHQEFMPLLLGMSGNDEITLHNCRLVNTRVNSSGLRTYTLNAQTVFIGIHFCKEEEIRFKEISIRYSNLDEWVGRRDLKVKPSCGGKATIQFEPSQVTEIEVNGYLIAVNIRFSLSEVATQVNVIQKAWIDISSEQEKNLDDYYSLLYHIRTFLSLSMGASIGTVEMNGKKEANKITFSNGKERYIPIQIRYYISEWETAIKTIYQHQMLFALPDIQNQLGFHLRNWIDKAESLKPVYDLFFATRQNPYIHVESLFLSLTQAIETYHRRKYGGKYQSDEVYLHDLYKRFLDVIPPNLDKSFRRSLEEGKLKYANEYSLRKRLKGIISEIRSNLPIGFLAEKNKKRLDIFIEKVHKTRNYLTHYTDELQAEAVCDTIELYKIAQRLRVLLEICLLVEAGFNFDDIKKIFSKTQQKDKII